MVNEQLLQDQWNEVKGKLCQKWGQLTQDDLQRFAGDVDKLVGFIQRKTGAAREAIEEFLQEVSRDGSSAVGRMAERVRQGVHQAAEAVQESSEEAIDYVKHGYGEAQEIVRERPAESMVFCFGVGLVSGLLVGLLARRQ
jgi:uncharacterized protein YjbJ (UPF0337 family)